MNYSDIFDVVCKYYPIGIDRDDPCYKDYHGSHLLELRVKEILSSSESKVRWKELFKKFKFDFPEILDANTDSRPSNVCYSAEILINEKKIENITHTLKLYCHLSYLGPFFCIYGKEEIFVEKTINITRFDPLLIVSPEDIVENYFSSLRNRIEEEYPEIRFLPFFWLNKRVKCLRIVTSDLKEYQCSSIFQALFTRENITDYKILGNELYK